MVDDGIQDTIGNAEEIEAVGKEQLCNGNEGPQRDRLIKLANPVELWHDLDDQGFGTVTVAGHSENIRIRTRAFRLWLGGEYYRKFNGAPGKQAVEEALAILEAEAIFKGECHQPYVRIAEYDDACYLDLCNAEWRAVKITRDGWQVVRTPPVKFIRSRGMRPLPIPERGGSIEDLRPLVNVGNDDEFRLIVVWLIAAFQPCGPYPVLDLNGEQGSAKSTLARLLRNLIDPNSAPIRSAPRNEHDLVITARNGWVISLDNLSYVQPWLSDALCRLSTGGGFAVRELYSDADEVLFDAKRPVILNGIPDLATRPDLADRKLSFTLLPIPDSRRKSEEEFWADFDIAHGRLLGAILDVVVGVERHRGDVTLSEKPRMADFALLGAAAEIACGWSQGSFLNAYRSNLAIAVEATVEADLVASAIRKFMNSREPWSGTATELLAALNNAAVNDVKSQKDWPKTGSSLAGKLRRAAPALRKTGVGVVRSRGTGKSHSRIITLTDEGQVRKTPSEASAPSDSVTNLLNINDSASDALSDASDGAAYNAVRPNPLKNNGSDASDASDGVLQLCPYSSEDDDIERAAIQSEADFADTAASIKSDPAPDEPQTREVKWTL